MGYASGAEASVIHGLKSLDSFPAMLSAATLMVSGVASGQFPAAFCINAKVKLLVTA